MVNSGRYVFRNTKISLFYEFCISVWVTYRPTDGLTNGQTGKLTFWTSGRTDGQTDRLMGLTDGPMDGPMDGPTDEQILQK